MMNNTQENANHILAVLFVLLQIVFVGLLAISISDLFVDDEIYGGEIVRSAMTPISNLTDVASGLPTNQIENIEQTLFGVVLNNSRNAALNQNFIARIVENTANNQYFAAYNIHFVNAVIDIPKMQQSYKLLLQYSDDRSNRYLQSSNQNYIILCPQSESEQLYPDFECKDVFGDSSQKEMVAEVLTYFDFPLFSATIQPDDLDEIIINPALPNTSDLDHESYIATTKEAVASLGVSPDLFIYHVALPADIDYLLTED